MLRFGTRFSSYRLRARRHKSGVSTPSFASAKYCTTNAQESTGAVRSNPRRRQNKRSRTQAAIQSYMRGKEGGAEQHINAFTRYMPNTLDFELAQKEFETLKEEQATLNSSVYDVMMRLAPDSEAAQRYFDEMQKQGFDPSVRCYNSLIHAYIKDKKEDAANELITAMKETNKSPNAYTYTNFIMTYRYAGNVAKAREYFDKMLEAEIVPTSFTYGQMFKLYANNADEATALYNKSCEAMIDLSTPARNDYIIALLRANRLRQAREQLHLMRASPDGKPTISTYKMLIRHFLRTRNGQRQLIQVFDYFKELSEQGLELDAELYTLKLQAHVMARDQPSAAALLCEMEKHGIQKDYPAHISLIKLYCDEGELDKALAEFEALKEKGFVPHAPAFNPIIRYHLDQNAPEEALKLYEEMMQLQSAENKHSKAKRPTNATTYNLFIKYYSDAKNGEKVDKFIKDMQEAGVAWDTRTFNALFTLHISNKDASKVTELANKMLEDNTFLNGATYRLTKEALEAFDVKIEETEEVEQPHSDNAKLTTNQQRATKVYLQALSKM